MCAYASRLNVRLHLASWVLLSTLACARTVATAPERYSLTPDLRAKLVELMGAQYVADLDTVYDAAQSRADLPYNERDERYDPTPMLHCLENVALGVGLEKKGKSEEAAQAFHNCAAACKNENDRPASPFREIAGRYAPTCMAARLKKDALEIHLVRFDREEYEVDRQKSAMNRYTVVSTLRGALRQAREGLPADDDRVVSRQRRLDDIVARYKADLDRVAAFYARDDVKAIRAQIDDAKAVVDERARFGTESQLQQAKEGLRTLDAKYAKMIGAAGI